MTVLVDERYDQRIRWKPGERLHHLFEAVCDDLRARGQHDRVAVSLPEADITYLELDARANGLARFLRRRGVGSGDRVGLLFDSAVANYVAILAVLKTHAAYVPLDAGFPPERIAYIAADSRLSTVLTESHLGDRLNAVDVQRCPALYLDDQAEEIADLPDHRLDEAELEAPTEELCYVIYTSGSTGVPKGVPIEHSSICNFVRVAGEVYGLQASDRMYQGMTIAFDFSIEEIWVAWMAAATLVPKAGQSALVGSDLRDFIIDRHVTAMSCVPTLLATIEEDVPGLRFLLVSGEACPQDLVSRWWRADRRFLNVYGPTEATVTATWTTLHPGRPVTIGVPLPTYSVLVLDPEHNRMLPRGETGEIAIAGIALSPGYLNRPDQTAKAFVPDAVGIPNNPSGMIYRTGDLGRITPDGQVECLGRIDTQVKIRGYRIELTEIESVLLQLPEVAAAVVEPYRSGPDTVELAAYVVRRRDCLSLDRAQILGSLRDRLPRYMIPAYVEELDRLPLLPSDKVDRKQLPAPTTRVVVDSARDFEPPAGPLEEAIEAVFAEVLELPRVSAVAHFFDELAVTSIQMTHCCARLRAVPELDSLRITDLYFNPSVRELALARGSAADTTLATTPAAGTTAAAPEPRCYPRVGGLRWASCALYQAFVLLAYPAFVAAFSVPVFGWIEHAVSFGQIYLCFVAVMVMLLLVSTLLPVLAKWVLIGRWRPREFPAWGVTYLRFWTVRMLLSINPIRFFTGTPLICLYLRMLGAEVGRRVLILTTSLPVTTDLLSIGPDTVINRGAVLLGYRIDSGWIRTGSISLGARALIGGNSVLDVDTRLGDDSQLGHVSTLLPGQAVPAGQRWHGVPGRPTDTYFRRGPETQPRWYRAVIFSAGQLALLVFGPAIVFAGILRATDYFVPALPAAFLGMRNIPYGLPLQVLVILLAAVGFVAVLLLAQILAFTVPRLLARALRPGVSYPVYGMKYVLHRTAARLTNLPVFTNLYGDSSRIVTYLSRLGYRLKPVQQTGSNFGMAVDHDIPYLCQVGTGTIVSDGLHFANTDYTSTGFHARPAILGMRNFLGNAIYLPADARVGDDVLLATKVALPLDGPKREGVGLLGSPCFEIPLRVGADDRVAPSLTSPDAPTGLRRKNCYNTVSQAMFLGNRLMLTIFSVLAIQTAYALSYRHGIWIAAVMLAPLPWVLLWWSVLVERASIGFHRLRPCHVSLYDPVFWLNERYWKLSITAAIGLFNGTPFKAWYLRALGIKVGRRLLDDGCQMVERTMIRLGDNCTLNYQSVLQCHSLENAVFKCEPLCIGDDATIGVRAWIHLGTTVGPRVTIETDSFLMKGEQVPAGRRWLGNPAGPARSWVADKILSNGAEEVVRKLHYQHADDIACRGNPALRP